VNGGILNDDIFVVVMKIREGQTWRVQRDSQQNDRQPSPSRHNLIHHRIRLDMRRPPYQPRILSAGGRQYNADLP
jgi:hypothetical protein